MIMKKLVALTQKIKQKLHDHGPLGAVKLGLERLRFEYRVWKWRRRERLFDQRYGTDTAYTWDEDTDTKLAPNVPRERFGYDPVRPDIFHRAIRCMNVELTGKTFIDFGSGKGRALLLASSHPFNAVIGVEFNPALHAIAERNIATYKSDSQKCLDLKSVCMDATLFPIPQGDLVIFMFNPFDASVLTQVFDNVCASMIESPREIHVVYARPLYREVIDQLREFKLVKFEPGFDQYTTFAVYRSRIQ